MTSHRTDHRHSHASDTPKGVFFEEPTDPAVVDALNGLRTALGPPAGPLQAAVSSLSVDEVGRLLTRTRANERRAALEHLGIANMAPRSIPASLSRDVAARLKKRPPVERHHALNHMCMAVMVDVARAIFEPAPDGLEARVSNLVATWGGPTLRTALWAICSASVPDARMWRWAVDQPWFCQDEADQEHALKISAAAAAVIDLTPDYAPGPFDKDALAPGHDEDDGDDREQSDELQDFESRDEDAPDPDAPEPDHDDDGYEPKATTPASQPEPGLAPSARSPESLAGLKAAHARAGELLEAATASAERAWGEVQASRAPKTADIDALRAVREAFDGLILALSSAGLDSDDESLPALGAAVARAAAAGADQPLADKLIVLTGLTVHGHIPALATALEQLQAEVRLLIDARPWDSDNRARAASLALLTDLVASGRLTSTARLELLTQLPADRPELSFLAVQAAHLRPAGDQPGAQDPVAAAADPAADHSTLPDVPPDAPEVALEPEPREPAGDELPAIPSDGAVEQSQADEAEVTPQSTHSAAAADPARHNEAPPVHGPVLSTTDPIEISAPDISPERAEHAHVVDTLATLLGQGRFGFAAQITHAVGWSSTAARTLRVAALAQAVRTQHGPCAAALRAELNEMDSNEVAHEHYLQLVAVPALIRAALITGESTCGALLTDLAPHLDPSLAAVADEVGRRALRGALAGAQVLAVLANVTGDERALSTVSEAAANVRDRHRSLRFKRASDIARIWLAPDGFLGRPLTLAASGKIAAVNDVANDIHRLSDLSTVTDELNHQDRKLKGPSGKPLQGAGRQDLLSLVQETVTALANWADLVLAGAGPSAPAEHWSAADLGAMRQAVTDQRDAVLEYLATQEAGSSQLVAGAAHGAVTSLGSTFDLLDGRGALASHSEPAPGTALSIELLRVPGAHVDRALQIVRADHASVAELLTATSRTWAQALETQVASENFLAARFLLDAAGNGTLPALDPGLDIGAQRDQVDAAERATRTALEQIHDDLVIAVRRARLTNQVTDEQDGELTGLLEDADPAGSDLAGVRRTLDVVASQLPMYTADAAAQLSDRLDNVATPDANADVRARIRRLIDDGQLSTAEELIYFLENGEPVPDVTVRTDLADFFPQVPQHLGRGVTNELIALVTARGADPQCPALDYRALSPTAASDAAEALRGWLDLAEARPEERNNKSLPNLLSPALRLIGIDVRKTLLVDDLPRTRDHRFYDLSDVTITGNPRVPEFGTKLAGRLRALLVWGQPTADLLMSWAAQDKSGSSLLIVHLGTVSPEGRRDLAVATIGGAPVIVLDDAALAYLAAHGNGRVDTTMRILLPFSAVNPYQRQKRGLVHEEMFYGRDLERRDLEDAEGSQLVYGGRGLGKSALLRNTQARFETQGHGGETRVAIYRNLDTYEIHANSPIGADAIWNALSDSLTARGLLNQIRSPQANLHQTVTTEILKWLAVDERRRLLILFDESDRFFEADAPNFLETKRLKDLGQSTEGRVKVVFAGLHSVQRYAKAAPNGPFSHMAQRPTVIGPLRPQHAANLLNEPLAALGFEFEDPDLVNRVLGYCSYQPFLLQMFAQRLVEAMHVRRRQEGPVKGRPPFLIARADIEFVESHPDLTADIRAAFRDTLLLDPRYDVIANVLAHHAHEGGLDARMSDTQLREECLGWWPDGFTKLDVEGFRAYLVEMIGLGVVAPNNDGRGWHLRSPNVLRMIGTTADVDTRLVGASTSAVGEDFMALETRLPLEDGRRSPLTASQMSDVLGDHTNQVRVVLGSRATGVELATPSVRAAAAIGDRFDVPLISRRKQFADELAAGTPGRRRVVLDDLVALDLDQDTCRSALAQARNRRPARSGVTRSAVLVAGPAQIDLWRDLLNPEGDLAADPAVGTVILRRYDAKALRVWSVTGSKFVDDAHRERLLTLTGGWPLLVDRVAQWVDEGAAEPVALRRLEADLAGIIGAQDLVRATGLADDPTLASAYTALVSLVEGPVSLADLEAGVEDAVGDAGTAVACLAALQVFGTDEHGLFTLEPVLMSAWQRHA